MALSNPRSVCGAACSLQEMSAEVKITEPEVLRANLSLDLMGDKRKVAPSLGSCGGTRELDLVLWDRTGD